MCVLDTHVLADENFIPQRLVIVELKFFKTFHFVHFLSLPIFLAHLICLSDVLLVSKVRNFTGADSWGSDWLRGSRFSREGILSGADSLSHVICLSQSDAQKSAPERIRSQENPLPRESAPIYHVICLSQSDLLKLERIRCRENPLLREKRVDSLGSGFSRERISKADR